ncbi:uncharacterized protein LOC124897565 [Capsicum annuum]|uniref:uncharacterized protein LOC124897565 n=1 Tax=Capsicum annuum TaxID=4072 RepID=UPI001FB15687|nr:uncharacterized protein LOC124897565 [Capsicum annuum]
MKMQVYLEACNLWEAVEEDHEVLPLLWNYEVLPLPWNPTMAQHNNNMLLGIENKIRILGAELNDNRVVQKILVTLPERYEITIASLENTKDLSRLNLTKLLSALHSQEQRRMIRQDGSIEGYLKDKLQTAVRGNKEK